MYAREGLLGHVLGAAIRLAWSANACSLPAAGTEQPSALVRPAFLYKLAPSHLILRLGHPRWAAAALHAARQHRRYRNRGRRSSWAPTKRGLGLDPFARHLLRITLQQTKMPGWVVTLSCQGCDAVTSSLQQLLLPFWRSFVLRISRLLRARTGSCFFVCSLASPRLHLLSPGERCRTRRVPSLGNQPRHKWRRNT
jgi:hypothetical protein